MCRLLCRCHTKLGLVGHLALLQDQRLFKLLAYFVLTQHKCNEKVVEGPCSAADLTTSESRTLGPVEQHLELFLCTYDGRTDICTSTAWDQKFGREVTV